MEIRLQKRIADAGFCSRRKAEQLIESGKVEVNGKLITKLGTKVSDEDAISINGKKLKFEKNTITIALHKIAGTVTTKLDPFNKNTVYSALPKEYRHLKPAGRLDKESEGLLILTSDGELIQKLTHPKHKHSKTYKVLVKGRPADADLMPLTSGKLKLDNYTLNPMKFKILTKTRDGKTWISLILSEGRNRQIRRVMDSLGFPVIYLCRTAIGKLNLEGIEKGAYRELSEEEIEKALL